MSQFYYVKCAGDGSYLKHAYQRTGPQFRGDIFTMNKSEAVKLKLREAERLGYPEGDPIYKLVPCDTLTLNDALSAARSVLREEDKECALRALNSLVEAVSATVEENRETEKPPFGGVAFDPRRKADAGGVKDDTLTNDEKADRGKAVVALYYLLAQREQGFLALTRWAAEVDLTQEPEIPLANMLTDIMHYCHRDEIEFYGEGNAIPTAMKQFNVESGGASL